MFVNFGEFSVIPFKDEDNLIFIPIDSRQPAFIISHFYSQLWPAMQEQSPHSPRFDLTLFLPNKNFAPHEVVRMLENAQDYSAYVRQSIYRLKDKSQDYSIPEGKRMLLDLSPLSASMSAITAESQANNLVLTCDYQDGANQTLTVINWDDNPLAFRLNNNAFIDLRPFNLTEIDTINELLTNYFDNITTLATPADTTSRGYGRFFNPPSYNKTTEQFPLNLNLSLGH